MAAIITSDRGLGPRGRRDIGAAIAAGRFQLADPELATVIAAGVLMGLAQILQDRPQRDDAQTTDQITESLLTLYGMSAEEARRICEIPLPDLSAIADAGSVA
jgi:hypothetical protein